MSSTDSLRLNQWLSIAYSAASDIQSIATASPSATATDASQSSPTDGAGGVASASASPGSVSGSAGSSQTAGTSNTSPSATSGSDPTSGSSITSSGATSPTGSSTGSAQSSAASSASSAVGLLNGSTTSGQSTSSPTSGAAAASSSAAAAVHHHSNTLAIALGTVFGVLALLLLGLLIFCCLRRRRSRRQNRRMTTPEDDEVDAWRGSDRATQPMMAEQPRTGQYYNNVSGPPGQQGTPSLSQHPAYRGMETGSSNPFVPVIPPPRRSAPNAKPGLTTDTVPGQDAYTTPPKTPNGKEPATNHHGGAVAAGAAGLATGAAAGAAAGHISRKPINGSPSRIHTSDLPEAVSPTEGYPNRYQNYHNDVTSPVSPIGGYGGGYGQGMDRPPSYGHARSPSHQPLMAGSPTNNNLPTNYTEDRPATPFGLMGAGAAGAAGVAAGAAATHHHDTNAHNNHSNSGDSTEVSRPSYESAAMYHSDRSSSSSGLRHHSVTPPQTTSRSPNRHARFSADPVELGPGAPRDRSSSSSARGTSRLPNPSPLRQNDSSSSANTDSGDSSWRLSSSMPGGWAGGSSGGHGHHTRESSHTSYSPNTPPSSHRNDATGMPVPKPMGRRLRLSDLRAQEEERARVNRETAAGGWQDHGYGYGGRPSQQQQQRPQQQQQRPSYDGHGYGGDHEDEGYDGGYDIGMAR